ncbi:hypothetical protein I317_00782 [Kwoniella heveanensis CBS 569]|uniref:Integral membrane protein n=1 Tax=Kwoniella heveanensis BCC8398 TaxID=1296120 RepID=A0A1B9GP68_9TREE|nr:hypothetical protein I316_05526 [Kwoniella heveanensis BCC8398]OCF45260.1 hypothetical protein I317_00782 [Kwoniella heveanensis CBS 569]
MPPALFRSRLVLALALGIVLFAMPTMALFNDPGMSYCKCICFSNSTIIPLYRPDNPKKPCLSCTRQFCLDQKLAICKGAEVPELDADVGTGTEGDVEARCFKRDSPRDQLVVTFFLLIVFGLLLYAAIRARLRRAIETRGQPQDLREWSEALLPSAIVPYSSKFLPGGRNSNTNRGWSSTEMSGVGLGGSGSGGGAYAPVSVGS